MTDVDSEFPVTRVSPIREPLRLPVISPDAFIEDKDELPWTSRSLVIDRSDNIKFPDTFAFKLPLMTALPVTIKFSLKEFLKGFSTEPKLFSVIEVPLPNNILFLLIRILSSPILILLVKMSQTGITSDPMAVFVIWTPFPPPTVIFASGHETSNPE